VVLPTVLILVLAAVATAVAIARRYEGGVE